MLFVCHPNFCISIVFSFSRGHLNSPEKLKTMLMHNFGVTNKEHYGMLWYFWSGQLEVFDPALLTHWQSFLLSSQVAILCLFSWSLSLCFFMRSGYHAFNVLFFKIYNTRRAMLPYRKFKLVSFALLVLLQFIKHAQLSPFGHFAFEDTLTVQRAAV